MRQIFKNTLILVGIATCLLSDPAYSINVPELQATLTCIAETGSSTWIGTSDGLWIFNKKTNVRRHLTTANSELPSPYITCICSDLDGGIWIGTTNGILRYDNYSFYALNAGNSPLHDDRITAIACDADGNIWIGTARSGIFKKIRYGRYLQYNNANGKLPDDHIYAINTDTAGNVWISYKDAGCSLIRNGQMSSINAANGFPGKNISYIAQDSSGIHCYCANGDVFCIARGAIAKETLQIAGPQPLLLYNFGLASYLICRTGPALTFISHDNHFTVETNETPRDAALIATLVSSLGVSTNGKCTQ